MRPEPTIRRMIHRDVAEVQVLEAEGGLSAWTGQAYADEIARHDSVALVVEVESRILGFAIGRLTGGGGEVRSFELLNIAVASGARRESVGRRLVDAVVTAARVGGATSVILEVRTTNEGAIAFYEALGFAQIAHRRDFYSAPPGDAYTYECVFEGPK